MERVQSIVQRLLCLLLISILFTSCSTSFKAEQIEEVQRNSEFEDVIKVSPIKENLKEETIKVAPQKEKPNPAKTSEKKSQSSEKSLKKVNNANVDSTEAEVSAPKHLPSLEDSEGFLGRRPIFDPFKVGENARMDVSFTGISAGTVELRVNPFLEVNGKKSYHFSGHAETNSFFSFFYKVNDWIETYVDYKDLVPHSMALHVRESRQFREARTYFNWEKLQGKHWEKKIRKGKAREKKIEWQLLPYSQNVLSAFFYLRLFKYKVGKQLKFSVADDGKNLIVQIDVLRKEKLKTAAGEFDCYVSKVKFEYNGVFKQTGDIFLWTIADQYQNIARLEAKIKLGTMVLELEKLTR